MRLRGRCGDLCSPRAPTQLKSPTQLAPGALNGVFPDFLCGNNLFDMLFLIDADISYFTTQMTQILWVKWCSFEFVSLSACFWTVPVSQTHKLLHRSRRLANYNFNMGRHWSGVEPTSLQLALLVLWWCAAFLALALMQIPSVWLCVVSTRAAEEEEAAPKEVR
jgi:hypothetical protein